MHRRIKIPSLNVPPVDYSAEANTFSSCGSDLLYLVKLKLSMYFLGQVAHIDINSIAE